MDIGIIFILKKAFTVLLMPWTIGFILALLSLFFIYKENLKKAKRYLTLSLLWMFFISWAPLANIMLQPLENSYERLKTIPKEVNHILLLGGDRDTRAWEVLRLYQQKPNITIITSGYSLHDNLTDAEKTATKLIESGIPKEKIIMLKKAKTTFEEAKAMKKVVGEKPFILVTAAYHMPRSMKVFRKCGLNPIAAPADFNIVGDTGFMTSLQSVKLQDTEHAWHEYLGLLVYKLQGKI